MKRIGENLQYNKEHKLLFIYFTKNHSSLWKYIITNI